MVSTAIMQPVYLPWIGYFEQILRTDRFMFLDDVQYTKWDWRSRNKIRTPDGFAWLTIPVDQNSMDDLICVKKISNHHWKRKHIESLRHNYCRSEFYEDIISIFRKSLDNKSDYLVDYTIPLVQEFCRYLGLPIPTLRSSQFPPATNNKMDRIIELCGILNADELYTGPAAKDYMDTKYMAKKGVSVTYQEYNHPVYSQIYSGFESHMSTIDLLMNHGPNSLNIIKSQSVDK